MVTAANRTIELGYGDCDDMAVLLGAFLMSVGVPVRFRVVGFKRPQHIFVEGLTEAGWTGLDPAAAAGDPHPAELQTYILEGYEYGDFAA
jgi:transglutaminase-like putative cysteine protease